MKKLSKLFILGIAALSFTSCGNDAANNGAAATDTNKVNIEEVGTRGVETIEFMDAQVSIAKEDIITVAMAENAQQDEDAVSGIMRTLMGAENQAQMLEVNFTMSDEPVSDMFVFGIETEEEKELTFEMFDEEGFEMAANNTISVTKGDNYKALNVKSLNEGTYFFKLKDDAGKELTRQVKIERE